MKMIVDNETLAFFEMLDRYRLVRSMAFESLKDFGLQPYFRGVRIQKQKLFFRFSHIAIEGEFSYKKESIKIALRREFKARLQECRRYNIFFTDIDCFLVRNPIQEAPLQPLKTNHYKERAKGNFRINPNSPFKEYFEQIREKIKENLRVEAEQYQKPSLTQGTLF